MEKKAHQNVNISDLAMCGFFFPLLYFLGFFSHFFTKHLLQLEKF